MGKRRSRGSKSREGDKFLDEQAGRYEPVHLEDPAPETVALLAEIGGRNVRPPACGCAPDALCPQHRQLDRGRGVRVRKVGPAR